MLQQTQVKTVIPYFERFMNQFPSVELLANAPLEQVLSHWSGLGYYSRAKNLHLSAKKIAQLGVFPTTLEGWRALPGIGPYTAGAILSIALEQPVALLDGNVDRVLSRLFGLSEKDVSKRHKANWKMAQELVSTAFELSISPSIFNQALMEMGAMVCLPKNPQCGHCPLNQSCVALQMGTTLEIPAPKVRAKTVLKKENFFLLIKPKSKKILLQKSKAVRWREGLWDLLPKTKGTRLEKNKFKVLGRFKIQYQVTHHKVTRQIDVVSSQKIFKNNPEQVFQWVSMDDILDKKIAVGSPVLKAVRAEQTYFIGGFTRAE
jgi:A/G-specific adenine glycosylase